MRPPTYIVDLDGVILVHRGNGSSDQWWPDNSKLLPNVRETFDAWEKEGAKVVIVTARPETLRAEVKTILRTLGLYWHALVMGVTSGSRYLINDRNPNGQYETVALETERNAGLNPKMLVP
jgi:hydroxymethylpyrimidine pyrophosphatase-like HAD family hydrolase